MTQRVDAEPICERAVLRGLCFLYGAHQQGSAQAAANQRTSTSPKLRSMVKAGAKANLDQARRLEGVFASAGLQPHGKHDKAMQSIIDGALKAMRGEG